ncbi:MAG: hypothetical protein ACREUE_03280 [Panacagrimonas sp.]
MFPGVWLASSEVTQRIALGLQIRFGRNMTAVLAPDGWVLFNPVRLSEAAEQELLSRGPIRHAVRLGTYHGRDDAYYVDQLGVDFWCVPGVHEHPEPRGAKAITEDGPFPLAGAKVVIFRAASRAECAVFVPEHRLLLTCDSVQNYEKDPLLSPLARIVMYPMGFFTPCVIGPLWLKWTTPLGASQRADFERILGLDFDNLIGGHGTPKLGGAKAALARNVARLR